MATKDLSLIEKSASAPPSSLAEESKQTTTTGDPAKDGLARRAFPTQPGQRVSSAFSVKLIAERAGTSTQAFREIQEQRCDIYCHGGLNE
jgi:hypothetical protein